MGSRGVGAAGAAAAGVAESWFLTTAAGPAEAARLLTVHAILLMLPFVSGSALAGRLADRVSPRRLLAGAGLVLLANEAALLCLSAAGALRPWMLLVAAFVWGSANCVVSSARAAMVCRLTPKTHWSRAQAAGDAGGSIAGLIGTGIGGLVIVLWGVTACWAIDVAASLAVLLMLAVMTPPLPTRATVATASSASRRRRLPRTDVALLVVLGVVVSLEVGQSVAPLLARETQSGTLGLAAMRIALSIGSAVGPFIARDSRSRYVAISGNVIALGCLQALIMISSSLVWSSLILFATSAAHAALLASVRQRLLLGVDDFTHGRVLGLIQLAATPFIVGFLLSLLVGPLSVRGAAAGMGGIIVCIGIGLAVASGELRAVAARRIGSLRVRDYRVYFTGEFPWLTFTAATGAAEMWLLIDLTGSAKWVTIAGGCFAVGGFIVAPWVAHVIAGRPWRRTFLALLGAWLARDVAIAALIWSGAARPWVLCAGVLVLGGIGAVDRIMHLHVVGGLVPRSFAINATSVSHMGSLIARLAGVPVAWLVVTSWGTAACAVLSAIGCGWFMVCIARIPRRVPASQLLGDAVAMNRRATLRLIRVTPSLWTLIACLAIVIPVVKGVSAAAPLLGARIDPGPEAYATVQIAVAAGSVLGAVAAGGSRRPRRRAIAACATGAGVTVLVGAPASELSQLALALALMTALTQVVVLHGQEELRVQSPAHRHVDVLNVYFACAVSANAIGGVLLGVLIDASSTRTALLVAGGVITAAGIATAAAFRYWKRTEPCT